MEKNKLKYQFSFFHLIQIEGVAHMSSLLVVS